MFFTTISTGGVFTSKGIWVEFIDTDRSGAPWAYSLIFIEVEPSRLLAHMIETMS